MRLPAIVTALIVALLAAWWALSLSAAQRKLAGVVPLPDTGHYRITLDFAPERFHQLQLQEAGRLVEVRGSTVYMKDVGPHALRSIAGRYWVRAIESWDGA